MNFKKQQFEYKYDKYRYYSEWIASYLLGIVREELSEAFNIFYNSALSPETYIVVDCIGTIIAYAWLDNENYMPRYIIAPTPDVKYQRMN